MEAKAETMGKNETMAIEQYSEAYNVHYAIKDLRKAIDLYMCIVKDYPDMKESDYSRAQIKNIANSVIPNQVYFEAIAEMAVRQLDDSLLKQAR